MGEINADLVDSGTTCTSAAISSVMAELESVTKDGKNAMQGYSFTSEAMVANTLRPLMAKHGLSLVPHNVLITNSSVVTTKNATMQRVQISATYLLLHKSGESLTITVPGEGMDSLDKSIPKALTMCLKYALLQIFCVGRGDDPDDGKGYESHSGNLGDFHVAIGMLDSSEILSENAAARAAATEPSAARQPIDVSPAPIYILKYGKYKGQAITQVDNSYLDWLIKETQEELKDPEKANFKSSNDVKLVACLREKQRRVKNGIADGDEEIQF